MKDGISSMHYKAYMFIVNQSRSFRILHKYDVIIYHNDKISTAYGNYIDPTFSGRKHDTKRGTCN